jgi:hypothetical protein
MRLSRFFKFIQSANSVIIFTGGILLLSVLVYAVYHIARDVFGEKEISDVVNTDSSGELNTKMTLSSFDRLAGTDYLFSPLLGEQSYRQDYYDKGSTSVRNYLFLNINDRSAQYLFSHNRFLLLRTEKILVDLAKDQEKVTALWYEIVQTDTNQDKRLTETDQKIIALSDVSGGNYKEVLSGIDVILGSYQKDDTTLLLLYESQQKSWVTEINITTRKAIEPTELPTIK